MLALVGSGQTSDAACQDLLRQVLAKLPHVTTATTNQRVTISYTTTGTTSTTLTVEVRSLSRLEAGCERMDAARTVALIEESAEEWAAESCPETRTPRPVRVRLVVPGSLPDS
jgi:hypothetical protein